MKFSDAPEIERALLPIGAVARPRSLSLRALPCAPEPTNGPGRRKFPLLKLDAPRKLGRPAEIGRTA